MYLEAILAQLDSKKQAYCLGWKWRNYKPLFHLECRLI
jgi:hypothetical protein